MTERKPTRRRLWAVVTTVLLTLLVVVVVLHFRPGIRVTIRNTGKSPMRSVVVAVTGNSYSLGDLPPGASGTVTVNSTGESSVGISFTDAVGVERGVNAGCYIEPGYRGTIELWVKDGAIEKNDQQITYP